MSRRNRRIGAAAVVLAAVATVSLAPPAGADLRTRLTAVVDSGATGAIVLVDNGTTVTRQAAGVSSLVTRLPLRPEARVRIASITKTFVAAVTLQLVDEGRFTLDARVDSLVPGLLPDGSVTVRQLLNHTSGLPEYMHHPLFMLTAALDPRYQATPRQLLDLAAALQPHPRGEHHYANTNYVALGMILEARTGQRVEDLVRQRVITPLGLTGTLFPTQVTTIPGYHARGYLPPVVTRLIPGLVGYVDITEHSPTLSWAAGAMISTADDLQTFFTALLSGRVVPARQLPRMMDTVPSGQDYGLGLRRYTVRCGGQQRDFWGHNGWTPGYVTYALHDATSRRGTVVAVPTTPDIPGLLEDTPIVRAGARLLEEAACASVGLPAPGAAARPLAG
jgi:D-alanyl-D-alanine carboxypeptidase